METPGVWFHSETAQFFSFVKKQFPNIQPLLKGSQLKLYLLFPVTARKSINYLWQLAFYTNKKQCYDFLFISLKHWVEMIIFRALQQLNYHNHFVHWPDQFGIKNMNLVSFIRKDLISLTAKGPYTTKRIWNKSVISKIQYNFENNLNWTYCCSSIVRWLPSITKRHQ